MECSQYLITKNKQYLYLKLLGAKICNELNETIYGAANKSETVEFYDISQYMCHRSLVKISKKINSTFNILDSRNYIDLVKITNLKTGLFF